MSYATADGTVYTCSRCGKRYLIPGGIRVSCCVIHAAGECCHYGEVRVTKKGWLKR